jgi:hypothetical protein
MTAARAMPKSGTHACEAIALAVRLHGRQRGWHLAAQKLGVAPDTARKINAGVTSGATINAETAFAARMAFRRERAAQLRAELAALEAHDNDLASAGDLLGMGRR